MTSSYEVRPTNPDGAVVRPPGSKSITNRAYIAAALATGRSTLHHPLFSDDTEAMAGCLASLGVQVVTEEDRVEIRSTGHLRTGGRLDARASGTTARFITAAATLADGPSTIDGVPRMRERPIGALVEALRQLGADVSDVGGFPPVEVGGGGLAGGSATIDVSDSSQFASAVMLAAPRADAPVSLDLGATIVSRPYLQTTMEVMRSFGAHVDWTEHGAIRIEATGYKPADYRVEADASAAVYPWAAAAITGSTITVIGIAPDSTQADMGALRALEAMGCTIVAGADGISVTGPANLRGADIDMNDCPDASLAIAVVAAFADRPSLISNIGNLRIKETDRLAALESELTKIGASAVAGPDWLRITPGDLHGGSIATYDDHRMAMSFAIAGLRLPGVRIEDPDCVSKTWPSFFDVLESL